MRVGTDRPRPARLTYMGARHTIVLSPALTGKLQEFNQAEKITPFMSLLAAFQVLMARHSGQADIVIGTPIANRTMMETKNLMGFFVNTLAMRADFGHDPLFRDALHHTKA